MISTEKKVNAIIADTRIADVHSIAHGSTATEEHYLCLVAPQDTIPAHLQAAGPAKCRGREPVTNENHRKSLNGDDL